MSSYRDYTNAVCACLRHATAKEKQAVAQELQDHLDDHAAALVEAGWDPEQAQAHALEAMGEAQEVGQALDREFPRRWLILSRVSLVLTILVVLVLLLPLFSRVEGAVNNLIARTDPFDSPNHTRSSSLSLEDFSPMDLRLSLPNGDVIRYFAMALTEQNDGTYQVELHGVEYNQNPFREPYYGEWALEYTINHTLPVHYSSGSVFPNGVTYWSTEIPSLQPGDTLTVSLDAPGVHRSTEIPLPWEEVTGP